MNTNIDILQDEIIDEFSGFGDWMDKYSYIIEMGNALPPIDEKHKTPDNIIEGCQSRVWLNASYENGILSFEADSDAIIVKGIISMLIRVLSGHTPTEILNANLYFIDEIYKKHCSNKQLADEIKARGYDVTGNYNSYNSNSSSSSSSSSTRSTCRICGGSGVCTSCNGSGGHWEDTGYYTGSGSKSWINCPSCNGSKKCFNCYGTGHQ